MRYCLPILIALSVASQAPAQGCMGSRVGLLQRFHERRADHHAARAARIASYGSCHGGQATAYYLVPAGCTGHSGGANAIKAVPAKTGAYFAPAMKIEKPTGFAVGVPANPNCGCVNCSCVDCECDKQSRPVAPKPDTRTIY